MHVFSDRYCPDTRAYHSVEHTYKGDLRDFQSSLRSPLFKNKIKQFCSSNKMMDPLIILGTSGSGKTLLANCIQGELEKRSRLTMRITCEAFIGRMIGTIKANKNVSDFIDELSRYDAVIFDEIEELRGRGSTQAEAARVISSLIDKGVKVALLGLPGENIYEELIKNLKKNRKQVSIINVPTLTEFERRKYIAKTASKMHLKLPRAGINRIAKTSNMAIVVGMLNTLTAFSEKSTGVKKPDHYTYTAMETVLGGRFSGWAANR